MNSWILITMVIVPELIFRKYSQFLHSGQWARSSSPDNLLRPEKIQKINNNRMTNGILQMTMKTCHQIKLVANLISYYNNN